MASLLFQLVSVASAVAPQPDEPAAIAFQAGVERMAAVLEEMHGCTFRFRSEEYISGSLTAPSVAEVKYRVEDDIHMKFTSGPNAGRELLYRGESWNGGKMKVDPGRFLPVLNLDPTGRLARRGNRHTIADLPLPRLGQKIVRDALKVRDHATWKPQVEDQGPTTIAGRAARCFDTRLPKDQDPSFYAFRVEVCLDQQTGLPSRLRVHDHEDGQVRLVEAYQYEQLVLNPGLTDKDFDPVMYGL